MRRNGFPRRWKVIGAIPWSGWDGDVVNEIVKLARNASVDLIVMGTDTKVPIQAGEDVRVGPLGAVTMDTLRWSPCPVLVIPPAMVPGLTRR
jgi:nucleotide-binding universal stress UspA family protein